MSKRAVEEPGETDAPLKGGERPITVGNGGDAVESSDEEFEDEFESEDEICEAGVDGRPDEEREAEEKRGMWTMTAV